MATKINEGGFGSIFKVSIGNAYAILKVVPHRHGIVCNILELILYFSKCLHIVQAYEYEFDNTCYKILMPPALYDLSKVKRAGKGLYIRCILYEIALAVEYLHSRYILHGDIKPSNILIYKEGDRYTAKLTDFSLARICNEKISGIAYTIGYRAPEVETLKIYTFKSDIWALGETFKALRDSFLELQTELFDNLLKYMCTVSIDKRFDIYDVLGHPFFRDILYPSETKISVEPSIPPIQVITDKILEHQNSPHSLIDFFREKVF